MRVLFNDVGEFVEELSHCCDQLDGRLVRVTCCGVQAQGDLPVRALYLIAGAVVAGDTEPHLVELVHYCGEQWPAGGPACAKTEAEAERVRDLVEARCRGWGLQVRRGRWQLAAGPGGL